ncbi:type II toxin-antitoxin system HigB family toxin [Aureimonas populi]|uniref:Type II toxin-antitoxin system HigB family toxin n=1 Tax=Aureimonas populi TaxID=1701758 RepID=A0ABW5CFB6_9HYPH|nr:type II toxin-antitoxin system HigB family toxin [Aureimonas populi]
MRIIARQTLVLFYTEHPEAKPSLERWFSVAKAASWKTTAEVQASFSKAKVLNAERVRFEVSGGNYRLIAAFDFARQIAFIKFVGTHAEYDRIDALTVSQF